MPWGKSDITSRKADSNVVPLTSSTLKISKTTSSCQAIQASVKNCGILNKGDTCYINATLQCLSTMAQFWSSFNAVSKTLSTCASSFVKIMSLLKSSKTATGPSQFLRFLKQVLVKSGRPNFKIFEQQDDGNFDLYFRWTWRWFHSCLGLGASQDHGHYRLFVLPAEYWQSWFFYNLSASGNKHSAVFFIFVFNTRTSFRGQFFYSVITVRLSNQPLLSMVFLDSDNSS